MSKNRKTYPTGEAAGEQALSHITGGIAKRYTTYGGEFNDIQQNYICI